MSVTASSTQPKPSKRVGIIPGDSPILAPLITTASLLAVLLLFVPNFASMRTISAITNASSVSAIVVIGVTLLMIAGEFDLSVGAVLAVGAFVFGKSVTGGINPILSIVIAVLVAAALGLINGLITIGTGIPSFIVTLGTRSIYRAAAWIYSGGLMLQTTDRLPAYGVFAGRLDALNDLFGRANFQTALLWAIGLGIIVQFLLTRTSFGNHVFASGGNLGAARSQGVDVKLVKLVSFTITGALAGLAGVALFSQFTTVFVATGTGLELTAIAAAVVGGTMLSGGVGSIIGGLIGIFMINMLRSGAILLGLPSDNFESIVGVAIIAAAIINERLRRRQ